MSREGLGLAGWAGKGGVCAGRVACELFGGELRCEPGAVGGRGGRTFSSARDKGAVSIVKGERSLSLSSPELPERVNGEVGSGANSP